MEQRHGAVPDGRLVLLYKKKRGGFMKFKRLAMTAAGLMMAGALTFFRLLQERETTDGKKHRKYKQGQ